jgi:hypothetical protein
MSVVTTPSVLGAEGQKTSYALDYVLRTTVRAACMGVCPVHLRPAVQSVQRPTYTPIANGQRKRKAEEDCPTLFFSQKKMMTWLLNR